MVRRDVLVAVFAVASHTPLAFAQPALLLEGPELQVNTYTTGRQNGTTFRSRNIARTGSNGFVTVWSSYGQDGSSVGIFGRRLDAAGSPRSVPKLAR